MGLADVFITGVHRFSDIGLVRSIIQNKRGEEPEFLNTVWTMQVIRSFFVWLCLMLITWPVATFYQEPRLLWLIPAISINTLIGGLNSTAISSLNRKMAVKQVVIFEFGLTDCFYYGDDCLAWSRFAASWRSLQGALRDL